MLCGKIICFLCIYYLYWIIFIFFSKRRFARAHFDLGEAEKDATKKNEYLTKGLELINKALELKGGEEEAAVHKVFILFICYLVGWLVVFFFKKKLFSINLI